MKKQLMTLLTTLSVSCAAGCNVAPLIPRSAASSYPPPGPNLAHSREVSLDVAIQWSVDDQEAINNVDWSLPVPLPTCLDAQVQCDLICEQYGHDVAHCIGNCSRAGLQCRADRLNMPIK